MNENSGKIEPAAEECLGKWKNEKDQHMCILSATNLSQAISLKRIADSLELLARASIGGSGDTKPPRSGLAGVPAQFD